MYVEPKGMTSLFEPNPQYKVGDLIRVWISKETGLYVLFLIDSNLIARMVKDERAYFR